MTTHKYRSNVQSANFFLLLVCIIVLISSGNLSAVGQAQKEVAEAETVKPKLRQPYCGLYCVYTAMKLAGKEVDFRELVKPEYLGSRKGSSLAELKKAVEDNGMYAESVAKLDSRVLEESLHPIILHVKSSAESKDYDHFELFLGTENGLAKLFNVPEPVRLVPFHELSPRWDGTGLIVSAEPIDLGVVFAPARRRLLLFMAVGIAVILILHWARQRLPLMTLVNSRSKLFGLSIVQAAGFGILALLCGMIYHFISDEGFLAHANATASIEQSHLDSFIPKIREQAVSKLLNTDTVFIDARLGRDFKAGHIDGAINVPVDICDKGRSAALGGIDKNAHVVVYCQSAGCKFANKLAIKLNSDGFSNLSIFKGGWNEWKAKEEK
ncbi:MAG: hypothetical protein ISS77_02430 [Phycisphaerae bacterium]|nr:hypothetical protein [Phycisphaerae bacterium]